MTELQHGEVEFDITVEDDLLVAIYLSFLFDCKKKRDKRNALCRCANSG